MYFRVGTHFTHESIARPVCSRVHQNNEKGIFSLYFFAFLFFRLNLTMHALLLRHEQKKAFRSVFIRHSRLPSQRRDHSNVSIVEQLRKEFADKKQQHLDNSKRDHAKILSVSGTTEQLTGRTNYGIHNKQRSPEAVYGFGVTRPDEV